MSNIITRKKPVEEEGGALNSHSLPNSLPQSPPHSPTHSPRHSPPPSPLHSPPHSPIPEGAPPTQPQYTPKTPTPLKSAMATHGSSKKKRVTISPHTSSCIDDEVAQHDSNKSSDHQDLHDDEECGDEVEEEDPMLAPAADDSPFYSAEPSESVSEVTVEESDSGGGCVDGGRKNVDMDEGLGGEVGHEPSSVTGDERREVEQQDAEGDRLMLGNTNMLEQQEGALDQQEGALDKMSENAVGSSPAGRFLKFDIEVGRGSFKTVYRGLDTETGVAVAWCELSTHKMTKNDRARFMEEGKMLKILEHRNILGFYDYWEVPEKRKVILVTELMTSGTLKAYMRRLKDVKIKFIRTWGRQILQGLHYLHTRQPPIIHRDLKCDNIFINGTTGLVKIGDLGLATLKVSHVKTVIGTPEFMAPEMYEEHYDESVDVYAFGMCLLEMFTLEYPYQECSNPAQVYKKVTAGIPPLSLEKVKNPALRDIALKCTMQHKEDRYTVQELLENPFFQLADYKIEVLPPDDPLDKGSNIISLRIEPQRLKLPDMEEGAATAFECTFDLQSDVPEDIAKDLVLQGIISSEDIAEVSKLIEKKVAQKREQEADPAVVTQQRATDERDVMAESASISPPHIDRQESGSALAAHSQQESPVVVKVDDTAVSRREESQMRSPQPEEPPMDPLSVDSLEPTPPSSAPPSSSSSPDNPPTTTVEAQQGPTPQPPPSLNSHMSDSQEELAVSKSSSKMSKVVPQTQEEVSGVGEKQKKQRLRAPTRAGKEGKRPLKLLLNSVQGGDLAECQFTSFGQQIKFTFSLQADTPDLLAENLMQAGLLQQEQKDEFCTLARSVIQQAKEKVHKEMQASEPLTMLSEHSASERQEVEETFTVVHSSAALEQASDKKDAVPCKPEQDPVAQREGDGHSSPVPQDRTTVVEHAAARKEAVASKEDKTFSKEEIPYREVGAPSRDSTPLVEDEPPPKEGKATPKEGVAQPKEGKATPKESVPPPKEGKATPKEGVAQPKEGGTLPDEGVVTPEEDETPPKEGRTPAKEGGTPPKEGGTPPKEGGAPPKEGGTLPKEGGAPPKDVAHNFSVPLSHQSSTDSSAVSTPSEPVKTVGESTAEEGELAFSVQPRPPLSVAQGPGPDSSHLTSSSLHMMDPPAVPVMVASVPPSASARPGQDVPPSFSLSVMPAPVISTMAPAILPSTSAPAHYHAATALPLDDTILHQRIPSELFPGSHPPTHPSPYHTHHHTWMGPTYQHPYPTTPWTSYLGAYQPHNTLPLPLPPVPLPQAPLPQPVPLPHRMSLPAGLPLAKTFVVETVAEPSTIPPPAKEEEATGPSRPFFVESIPEWELEGSQPPTASEGKLDPSLVSSVECPLPDEGDLLPTCEERLPVPPPEAEVGQVPRKETLPFDPKDLQVMDGALGMMMYSMLQVLKNPKMTQLVNELERKYSGRSASPHSSNRMSPETDQNLSCPPRSFQDEGAPLQAPLNTPDQELEALRREMEEERQKLDKQHEERLLEYSRRRASVAVSSGVVGQSEKRAEIPLLSQSERHLKTALDEANRQTKLQGGAYTQQPLVVPTSHQLPLYMASRDGLRPHFSHPQALGPVQYHTFPQGAGLMLQEGAVEGLPPQLPHHLQRLPPPAALSWGGTLSYQLPSQQHGSGPHAPWPSDQQHGSGPHAPWPSDQQHGSGPHAPWPSDQQHGSGPHAPWPSDQQHGSGPHAPWPSDQQHGSGPHAPWPSDQQHGSGPHAPWPSDQQHGSGPHAPWPSDQKHSSGPHAPWSTDHFPHVPGKQ